MFSCRGELDELNDLDALVTAVPGQGICAGWIYLGSGMKIGLLSRRRYPIHVSTYNVCSTLPANMALNSTKYRNPINLWMFAVAGAKPSLEKRKNNNKINKINKPTPSPILTTLLDDNHIYGSMIF